MRTAAAAKLAARRRGRVLHGKAGAVGQEAKSRQMAAVDCAKLRSEAASEAWIPVCVEKLSGVRLQSLASSCIGERLKGFQTLKVTMLGNSGNLLNACTDLLSSTSRFLSSCASGSAAQSTPWHRASRWRRAKFAAKAKASARSGSALRDTDYPKRGVASCHPPNGGPPALQQ